jgi:3-oxoacyl-[acyl-carrier-protein] synthase II
LEIVVTGIGLISVLGDLDSTWQRLLACQSGIQLRQPFSDFPARPLALIHKYPQKLLPLAQAAVTMAVKDALLVLPLPDCGVAIGSSRGQQGQWEAWARQERETRGSPSPSMPDLSGWLEALPHWVAIATAQQIGSVAAVRSPMAACATGLWAIAQGCELLQTGQCEQVIAGAVEAPITPLTLTGFEQAGALAPTGSYPFDRHRQGLVLGEGGAVLILETAASAQRRSVEIYGRVLGHGFTTDAYHVSAPDPSGRQGAIAIQQCLDRSQLAPNQIGYIHAHGTATRHNDQNEASLIQRLFPPDVWVSSTKGATGHTLGASGALGVALSLMALKHQVLPPCVGLSQPEFDLNFVTQPVASAMQAALCLSFGFGGQNGAIALSR